MKCLEKGTNSPSEYYFFSPSEMFRNYYLYMLLCGHFYCDSNYKILREGNVSPLFIYMLSGQLSLQYENNLFVASSGDIVLLNCKNPHSYYCTSSCEFIFFHYDGINSQKMTDHLILQNQSPIFRLQTTHEIPQQLLSLLISLSKGSQPSDIELSCVAYNALCGLQSVNCYTEASPSPMSATVENVIKFMKENIQETLSLDYIASHVNVSSSSLSHLFKTETGCSPIEYMSQLKINFAKTILRSTNRTVSDIGLSLGYSSSSSFINAFSSRTGISPKQFRHSKIL